MSTLHSPDAEIEVDHALVAHLLEAQHADLLSLPLGTVHEGWDNTIVRLGEEMAVRLPRRAVAAPLLAKELRWLPELSWAWPFRSSAPVRPGRPTDTFPFPWAIVRWVAGEEALHTPLHPSEAAAFGRALKAIHVDVPSDAPTNPFRSVPLTARDEAFQRRLLRLDAQMPDLLDFDAVQDRWQAAMSAPVDRARVWIHGDLHPRNVITTADGQLAGIIDWGDAAAGDPATDLGAAWMHFSPDHVDAVFDAYGTISDATRLRAEGAALALAMAFAVLDDPLAHAARNTFERLGVASRC